MKLSTLRTSDTRVDAALARALPQPPGAEFDTAYGFWTPLGSFHFPPASAHSWIGSIYLELLPDFTGTPLVQLAVIANATGTSAVTDICMPMAQLGRQRSIVNHLESYLWGGDAGNDVSVWIRQFIAPGWADLGDFGAFSVRDLRVALGKLPTSPAFSEPCRSSGYYQHLAASAYPYAEAILAGKRTITPVDGWTRLVGPCPAAPVNCLTSVPASVRTSICASTSALPASAPPIGSRCRLQLRANGQPHREFAFSTTGIDPLEIDFPSTLSVPAASTVIELWALPLDAPLTFDYPILWLQGVPTPALPLTALRATAAFPEAWIPLTAPLSVPAGFDAIAVSGTAHATIRSSDPIDLTYALTVDGCPRDRYSTVHRVPAATAALPLQEFIEIDPTQPHVIELWATATDDVLLDSLDFTCQPYPPETI